MKDHAALEILGAGVPYPGGPVQASQLFTLTLGALALAAASPGATPTTPAPGASLPTPGR